MFGAVSAIAALLGAAGPAHAGAQLRDLTCAEASTTAVAKQPWSPGRSPYGLPYEDWTADDFAKLKVRIRECGGDPAYIGYQQQLQARTRPSDSARLAANFAAELGTVSKDPTLALQQFDDLSRQVKASSMDLGDKASIGARIANQRRGEVLRKASEDRARAEVDAEPHLRALIDEVEATPATAAGRRQLVQVGSGNRYQLPELTFQQQNRYEGAIGRRIQQIDGELTLAKCAPLVARMGLPTTMARHEVVDQLGTPMNLVVCQSYVATGHGEFRPMGTAGAGIYAVRSGQTILVFQLGRYVKDTGAFFPPSAPIQRGTPAFRFEGVRDGSQTQPASRGFLINFLAQYTGPWTEFLRAAD